MSMESYEQIVAVYNKIIADGDCINIRNMHMDGNLLREIGITDGKQIGQTLKHLFFKVVDEPQLNDREKLIEIVKNEIMK